MTSTLNGTIVVPGTDHVMVDVGLGVFAAVVEITPTMAEEWLTDLHEQRPITAARVNLYARDMQQVSRLCEGVNLQIGDAPHTLRRLLENNANQKRRIREARHWAYLVKAMNAWVADRELLFLRWSEKAEGLPLLRGFDYLEWQTRPNIP